MISYEATLNETSDLPTLSSKLLNVSALMQSNLYFNVRAKSVKSTKCCQSSLSSEGCEGAKIGYICIHVIS